MSDDLLKRLLKPWTCVGRSALNALCREAATEIERLEAENARLREALGQCRAALEHQQQAHAVLARGFKGNQYEEDVSAMMGDSWTKNDAALARLKEALDAAR